MRKYFKNKKKKMFLMKKLIKLIRDKEIIDKIYKTALVIPPIKITDPRILIKVGV